MEKYDLLVIGGGMAGLSAAKRGADLGAKVALAEYDVLGGT
jgi:pyruvate/2-oxoglutarate dehydrogenase complex dihydrolipoamide dehydrogenase (E3) component